MRRLLFLPLLAGCVYVGGYLVGSSVVYYGVMKVSGNVAYTDYRATQRATWEALIAELEARKIEYKVKEEGIQLSARGYTAETIAHPKEREYTRIQVRVGMVDQEERHAKAREFLLAVGQRLGHDKLVPDYPGAD